MSAPRETSYCVTCESTVYADDVHSCYDAKAIQAERALLGTVCAEFNAYPHASNEHAALASEILSLRTRLSAAEAERDGLRERVADMTMALDAEFAVRKNVLFALEGQGLPKVLPEHGHGVITDAHALYERCMKAEQERDDARQLVEFAFTEGEASVHMDRYGEHDGTWPDWENSDSKAALDRAASAEGSGVSRPKPPNEAP